MTSTPSPLVLLAPAPQSRDVIFTPDTWRLMQQTFTVIEPDLTTTAGTEQFDELLPIAFAVVGQPDLPRERLETARELRAVCNVEGNFFPNVDYKTCADRGVYVLGCGPAYAQPVAEYGLGLGLDIARGISRADRLFRVGDEQYTAAGNADAMLLRRADIGLIGFGNLGRALARLLAPFDATIRVHDPWLPDAVLRDAGVQPSGLEELLTHSKLVFVLATITDESTQLLDAARLDLLPDKARLVLLSRAAAADFDALYERIASGRLIAAIDVWPTEPMPADDAARGLDGATLSAHRAGGIREAFHDIGAMVLDDLTLIRRGLPPARMQVAARELVTRYRSRPVSEVLGTTSDDEGS
ncbi:NAD(P)-dependent oxidoreductase [uncultured Jatrophihabitans sp.]|uniref:NAD(P)-dependent oxidoreductase n=1 Tax=uncultured Jatrophihabitans sp. TaxID=1610747 RepID=UPI0035CC79DF